MTLTSATTWAISDQCQPVSRCASLPPCRAGLDAGDVKAMSGVTCRKFAFISSGAWPPPSLLLQPPRTSFIRFEPATTCPVSPCDRSPRTAKPRARPLTLLHPARARTVSRAEDNYGNSYDISSSGTNSQGNHYCSRDYGSDASNSNSYHCESLSPAPLAHLDVLTGVRWTSRRLHRQQLGRLVLLLELGRVDLCVPPLVLAVSSTLAARASSSISDPHDHLADYNSGSGYSNYTSPSGQSYESSGGKK